MDTLRLDSWLDRKQEALNENLLLALNAEFSSCWFTRTSVIKATSTKDDTVNTESHAPTSSAFNSFAFIVFTASGVSSSASMGNDSVNARRLSRYKNSSPAVLGDGPAPASAGGGADGAASVYSASNLLKFSKVHGLPFGKGALEAAIVDSYVSDASRLNTASSWLSERNRQ
jgi:hypothetical protein